MSPKDGVETRRVTLTNQSSRQRHIEVTSFAEVAPGLTDTAENQRYPIGNRLSDLNKRT